MRLFLTLSALLLLAPAAHSQSAEQVGRDLIKAYQKKDAAGVKKHMAPLLAAAVGKKFFEEKETAADVAALKKWDGKILGVRYFTSKFGVMAAVHYADDADPAKVRLFSLIKSGRTWKHGMDAFYVLEREKFLAYDAKEPSGPAAAEPAAPAGAAFDENSSNKGYAAELADGTKAEAPSAAKLRQLLATLSDDNFFITLTGPKGFMQAGYTAKGLDMQYKDAAGHFAGEAPVTPETAAAMFTAYLSGGEGWKAQCKWKPFE